MKSLKLIYQIILKEKDSLNKNVYRYSNTRAVSSKINNVLTATMVEYLNVLIHHLLLAGILFDKDTQ